MDESCDTNFTDMVGSEPAYLSFLGPSFFHVYISLPSA
jgi:hypothetical protein